MASQHHHHSNHAVIDLAGDGGVLKEIKRQGEEEDIDSALPKPNDEIRCHYVGRLTDGTLFDSSRIKQRVFKFHLGQGKVIKGWDVGFATMKRGEIAVLTLRSDYAYGEEGIPGRIPPNATLVFECEMLGFGEHVVGGGSPPTCCVIV